MPVLPPLRVLLAVATLVLFAAACSATADTEVAEGAAAPDVRPDAPEGPSGPGADDPDVAGAFGDDPTLDGLYTACENEDWRACDALYVRAAEGTAYNEFGDTCGGRAEFVSSCEQWAAASGEPTVVDLSVMEGELVDFYRLTPDEATCVADLIFERTERSDLGELLTDASSTEYLAAAEAMEGGGCVDQVAGPATVAAPPGTDAALDDLWQQCVGEDWEACDLLYDDSPVDSDYETFGLTCGGRVTTFRFCTDWAG